MNLQKKEVYGRCINGSSLQHLAFITETTASLPDFTRTCCPAYLFPYTVQATMTGTISCSGQWQHIRVIVPECPALPRTRSIRSCHDACLPCSGTKLIWSFFSGMIFPVWPPYWCGAAGQLRTLALFSGNAYRNPIGQLIVWVTLVFLHVCDNCLHTGAQCTCTSAKINALII